MTALSAARQRPWWLAGLLLLAAARLPFLDLSPPIGYDETSLAETGRVLLGGDPSWSTNWSRAGGPVRACPVLGCIPAELAYRLAGSPRGPRVLALAGAMLAAWMLWLCGQVLYRSGWTVDLLAWTFFMDPLFIRSYWYGRADAWAIAAALGAAWLCVGGSGEPAARRLIASGAALGAATAVWFTGFLAAPAVVLIAWRRLGREWRWWKMLCGGCLASLAIHAAIQTALAPGLQDVAGVADWAAVGPVRWVSSAKLAAGVISETSLPAAILSAVACMTPGSAAPLISAAALAAMLIPSTPYQFRLVYALPWLYAVFLFQLPRLMAWSRRRVAAAVCLAALHAVGLAAAYRTAWLWRHAPERDTTVLVSAADRWAGNGPKTVFLFDAAAFYPEGRRRGWRMYHPFLMTHPRAEERGYAPAKSLAAFQPDLVIASNGRPVSDAERQQFGVEPCPDQPVIRYGYYRYSAYCRAAPSGRMESAAE